MNLKFEQLSRRTQATVLASLVAVLAGFAFWYLVWPLRGQQVALQGKVAALTAENQKNRAFEQQRTEYLHRIAQLDDQLASLRSIVPDEPELDEFLLTLNHAEAAAGIHVRDFTAEPQVAQEMYVAMPFKMHVDGSYYKLVSFFNEMAHGQRIVSMTDLSLGTAKTTANRYKIQPDETVGADLVLTTYFNHPQTTAPAPAAKAAGR